MNPLLNLLGGNIGGGSASTGGNPMKQAVIAMMSGQSPESFLSNLAKTDSRFQGLDFSNLEQTAHDLCKQKGVDENQAIQQVQNSVKNMM